MSRKRELLFSIRGKDVEWQTFRAGGSGGQNQNKRETGVRCKHHPSGATGECREHRTQLYNKRTAFRRMAETPTFDRWARLQALGFQTIDDLVDEMLTPENLVVEILDPRTKRFVKENG